MFVISLRVSVCMWMRACRCVKGIGHPVRTQCTCGHPSHALPRKQSQTHQVHRVLRWARGAETGEDCLEAAAAAAAAAVSGWYGAV